MSHDHPIPPARRPDRPDLDRRLLRPRHHDPDHGGGAASGSFAGSERGPGARLGRGLWRGAFPGDAMRARRGDIRSAILALLVEAPMHGYQVIGELEQRSGGRWRPSAGSVYPTLQQLEDEGLVRAVDQDGRHVYELTSTGQAAAAETRGRARPGAPWERHGGADGAELRRLLAQIAAATVQVAQVGRPTLTAEARTLLTETRRGLYRLLAEDDGPLTEPHAADSDAEPADDSSGGPAVSR